MGYRGEDLDLRTPQGWGAAGSDPNAGETQANGWWTRSTIYAGGRADPLWVDGMVLECCNHAFDLALVHRAAEVRLEHLLHAITLNEASALILEQRGFRVLALRRESTQRLAGDGPLGPSNAARPTPKKSRELEEALRLAADYAYPRRTPVTLDALLHVLMDVKTDSLGAQMLSGCGPGQPKREPQESPTRTPLVPAPEGNRFAWEERAQPAAPYYAREPLAPAPRQNPVATTDNMADMRLAYLERMVGDVLGGLLGQRRPEPERGAPLSDARLDGLFERLTAIERRLHQIGEASATPAQPTEQLSQILHALADLTAEGKQVPQLLQGPLQSLAGWDNRLAELERTGTVVLDRLTGLERQIQARLDAVSLAAPLEGGEMPADLVQRLSALEQTLQDVTTVESLKQHLSHLAEAMDEHDTQLERMLGDKVDELRGELGRVAGLRLTESGTAEGGSGPSPNMLEMQDALLRLSTNQAAIASALEQWRLDNTGDLAVLGNRMQDLETLLTRGWLSAGLNSAGRLQRWLSVKAKQEPGKQGPNAQKAPWRKRRLTQPTREPPQVVGDVTRPSKGSSTPVE